jgi:hypothetical protein
MRTTKAIATVVAVVVVLFTGALRLISAAPEDTPPDGTSMATEDRVQLAGWWPTKGTAARGEFIGSEACTRCHAEKAASQKQTPMFHAAMKASDSEILHSHPDLRTKIGPYDYAIVASGEGIVYSASENKERVSAALRWAFGVGEVGQTYVYEKDGNFYESRLSFYKNIGGLDFSPGHPRMVPASLDSALGRQFRVGEAQRCFGCHTTASTTGNHFDEEKLMPGVTCEACHGPGAEHVVAMTTSQGERVPTEIMNPRTLKPVDSVEFCGACHRTTWDVALAGSQGIYNIRFQPYRLESSRCWGNGDARLTCVACHDPHKPLVRDAGAYTERCLSCHLTEKPSSPAANHSLLVCPVSKGDCVSCHMPKFEIPGMHAKFTDHKIRIPAKGGQFTD